MSMQSILAASQSMARMQTLQSTRTQLQGSANVLRAESKQDGGSKEKDAQAAALEEKSNLLAGNLMDEITDVNETLKPDEEVKAEETSQAEETAKKQPKTDTVELSDSVSKYIGEGVHEKPAVLEAVTYQSDGSTKPSAPAKSTPTLQATA